MLNDTFKILTNTDKGLWFNFINLTRRPQKTILDFLYGKRKGLVLPLQYVIIGLSFLILVDSYFGTGVDLRPDGQMENFVDQQKGDNSFAFNFGMSIGKVIRGNLKYFLLLNVVLFALPAKLFYKKYTLAEHITIQAFILGHAALITVLLFPVMNWSIIANPIFLLSLFILNFLFFFKRKEIIETLLSSIFILLFGGLLFFMPPVIYYVLTK